MSEKQKLIGRESEKLALEQVYQSNSSQLVAVYGRRRVGKTFLVRQFFKTKPCVFFNMTGIYQGTMKEQIQEFAKAIGNQLFAGLEVGVPKNWFHAFEMLTKALQNRAKKQRIILFFDEFPWMATPKSKLLSAFEFYWNQYWVEDHRMKIIICGSASSWIIKNVINNKGGLHNRVTQKICLEPMSLKESKQLLSSMKVQLKDMQLAEIYMAMGGIPYYLAQIPKGLSATQIIEKLAFSKNGFLLDEFKNLYAALFEEADVYIDIVRTIASCRYGIRQPELCKRIKKVSGGGSTSEKLKALEDAGFIISFIPFKHSRKGVFYKVVDEYTLFYFHWIEPLQSTLTRKGLSLGYWDKMHKTPAWGSWAGYAFEAICYKHIEQIKKALKLGPTALPSAWQYMPESSSGEDGAQIDLIFDRDDDAISICEIKYTQKPFAINKHDAQQMLRKLEVFKKRAKTSKQLFLVMISANGMKETMYSEELISAHIDLSCLFS